MSHSLKTKKALSKRVKITAGKKIMKRPPGQNHFNAKQSGDSARAKHGDKQAPSSLMRDAKALLQNI